MLDSRDESLIGLVQQSRLKAAIEQISDMSFETIPPHQEPRPQAACRGNPVWLRPLQGQRCSTKRWDAIALLSEQPPERTNCPCSRSCCICVGRRDKATERQDAFARARRRDLTDARVRGRHTTSEIFAKINYTFENKYLALCRGDCSQSTTAKKTV
jgi:hypothetical protein